MSFSPAFVDAIVAEVTRRLAGADGEVAVRPDSAAALGSTANHIVDLTAEAVLTGSLITDRCGAGQQIRIRARAVQTPTARDAIRTLNLSVIETSQEPGTVTTQRSVLLCVQSGAAVDRLAERLGWCAELVSQREAVERGRSVICRGESPSAVVLTSQPHEVAARLNRQSKVWAAAATSAEQWDTLTQCPRWNVLCTEVSASLGYRLPELLTRFATTRAGAKEAN